MNTPATLIEFEACIRELMRNIINRTIDELKTGKKTEDNFEVPLGFEISSLLRKLFGDMLDDCDDEIMIKMRKFILGVLNTYHYRFPCDDNEWIFRVIFNPELIGSKIYLFWSRWTSPSRPPRLNIDHRCII